MTTSLVDLTFESKYHADTLFPSSQVVGINGLVPSPDVGLNYYYPPKPGWWARHVLRREETPPYAAIAVSRDHSFRMVGTMQEASMGEVVESAELQVSKVRVWLEKIALELSKQASLAGRMAVLAANGATDAQTTKALERARVEAEDSDQKMTMAREQLTEYLGKHPGVLIARWKTKNEDKVDARAGKLAQLASSSTSAQDGFVILAGIRVSMLVFGDDFAQMVATMTPSAQREFESSVINSHVLQAQSVAYVSARDFSSEFELAVEATKEALDKPGLETLGVDSLRLQLAIAQWASLGNSATFGPIAWRKSAFCFMAGHDLEDLDAGEPGNGHAAEGAKYMTVIAQLVYPGKLIGSYSRQWKEEYERGELPPRNQGLVCKLRELAESAPDDPQGAPRSRAAGTDGHATAIESSALLANEKKLMEAAYKDFEENGGPRPRCMVTHCAVYDAQVPATASSSGP